MSQPVKVSEGNNIYLRPIEPGDADLLYKSDSKRRASSGRIGTMNHYYDSIIMSMLEDEYRELYRK